MCARKEKQNAPVRVSRQQLAAFGLELVTPDPLAVRCLTCGVEWRPVRSPRAGHVNNAWRCQNGCHLPKE